MQQSTEAQRRAVPHTVGAMGLVEVAAKEADAEPQNPTKSPKSPLKTVHRRLTGGALRRPRTLALAPARELQPNSPPRTVSAHRVSAPSTPSTPSCLQQLGRHKHRRCVQLRQSIRRVNSISTTANNQHHCRQPTPTPTPTQQDQHEHHPGVSVEVKAKVEAEVKALRSPRLVGSRGRRVGASAYASCKAPPIFSYMSAFCCSSYR